MPLSHKTTPRGAADQASILRNTRGGVMLSTTALQRWVRYGDGIAGARSVGEPRRRALVAGLAHPSASLERFHNHRLVNTANFAQCVISSRAVDALGCWSSGPEATGPEATGASRVSSPTSQLPSGSSSASHPPASSCRPASRATVRRQAAIDRCIRHEPHGCGSAWSSTASSRDGRAGAGRSLTCRFAPRARAPQTTLARGGDARRANAAESIHTVPAPRAAGARASPGPPSGFQTGAAHGEAKRRGAEQAACAASSRHSPAARARSVWASAATARAPEAMRRAR